jgi:hypothetical protein
MCIARSIPRIVTTAIAERCRREFPEIQLTVLESWRQQLQADRLTADLALIFHPEQVGLAFVSEPLVQDELVLVCSANEPQVPPPEIDLGRAFRQPLILPSRPHYLRQFVETTALSAGHELRTACEIDSLEVTKELVARGVANAILPIACIRDEVRKEKLRYARIRDPRFQRILYMVHSREPRSVMIDLFCREIRAVIFECADQETFGWRRIHLTEQLSSDERPHHQSPDRSGRRTDAPYHPASSTVSEAEDLITEINRPTSSPECAPHALNLRAGGQTTALTMPSAIPKRA